MHGKIHPSLRPGASDQPRPEEIQFRAYQTCGLFPSHSSVLLDRSRMEWASGRCSGTFVPGPWRHSQKAWWCICDVSTMGGVGRERFSHSSSAIRACEAWKGVTVHEWGGWKKGSVVLTYMHHPEIKQSEGSWRGGHLQPRRMYVDRLIALFPRRPDRGCSIWVDAGPPSIIALSRPSEGVWSNTLSRMGRGLRCVH